MATTPSVRFEDIDVETPTYEDVAREYAEIESAFDAADDAAGRLEALRRWDTLRRRLGTWGAWVHLRFSQDTRDPERKKAREHADQMIPKLTALDTTLMRKLIDSPHRPEIEAAWGTHVFDVWACEVDSYDPIIEAESVQESKLGADYMELLASARFEIEGETVNLSQLGRFDQHRDREIRHRAARLRWDFFGENADRLDGIFDELVGLRRAQASKLGYPTYVELAYRKRGRVDYGPEDVARYRKEIREQVVPLCTALRERQRDLLGVDELMAWDEPLHHPDGNPDPKGDKDWMISRAREMFDTMGHGLGSFFDMMVDGNLIDLDSREGKAGGGFCTSFPTEGVPFVFANFNGTKGDAEVFTHEMGHAFQGWSSRDKEPIDLMWPTADACEVHSMSLEFLTWPHMERFFEDDAQRFRDLHLAGALRFLPYGVAVDHFQHLLYERPDASPDERNAMWQEMEETYLPGRRWGDLARPASGGFWQRQMHIYQVPFYYIDYTLAQVCALQFWVKAGADRAKAMEDYVALCRRGGEAPFQTLVRSVGLRSPFEPGCLDEVVTKARQTLDL